MCLIFIYISIPTCCSYESCFCFIMTFLRNFNCFITCNLFNPFITIAKIVTIRKVICFIVTSNIFCNISSANVTYSSPLTFYNRFLPSIAFLIYNPNFFGFVLCIVPSFALVWVFCCRLCSRCRCRLT